MRRAIPLLLALVLSLAACGRTTPAQPAAPTNAPTSAPAADAPTPAPSATTAPTLPPPTATVAAPTVPVATLTAALSATVVAALPPTATAAPGQDAALFTGITGAAVEPLAVAAGERPLWLVSSVGFPDYEQSQRHFVAIYAQKGDGWQELARHEIENADALLEGGVAQVQVAPGRLWLLVQSGVGAHSGCAELLSFDGSTLKQEVAGCNSSPFAGEVRDLDGDGTGEMILNASDNYVFCYACGERYYSYGVFRWDGQQMQILDLTAKVGTVGEPLHDALALARLGLWKDAAALLDSSQNLGSDPLAQLYAATIRLHTKDFAEQVQNAQYPLLDNLFYGDYAAALAVLRALPPDQLFAKPSPLVAGTAAEGWESSLTYWITTTTTTLIDSNIGDGIDDLPEVARSTDTLAAAHFLRGWALTLSDPPAPEAIADIEQAAQLKPDDQFFAAALAAIKR